MAKFSHRLGITKLPTQIQVDGMSAELRNSLWNLVATSVPHNSYYHAVLSDLFVNYFKLPLDELPQMAECRKWLLRRFLEGEWYEVYNLVEYILQSQTRPSFMRVSPQQFIEKLNFTLERELSGYRAINGEIVPITDSEEVEAIRKASETALSLGLDGPHQHILAALHLLGKKPEPDYRNSIKESISAVEGVCKLLTGEKSGGIKTALEKLSSKVYLHKSFKKSLLSLYGYTSDEAGIRHPLLEEKDVGFAEAKFMLVTCSAFVNFLIDKARQSDLL